MKIEMSEKAVTARLKLVGQLWRLSLALGQAKKIEIKQEARVADVVHQKHPVADVSSLTGIDEHA